MTSQSNKHRRSVRLPNYDYSSTGYYFVTICAKNRECLFGEIVGGEMRSNEIGKIIQDEWLKTPVIRPNIELDQYIIMPNHFHAIFHVAHRRGELNSPQTAPQSRRIQSASGRIQYAPTGVSVSQSPSQTVGAIIRGFKSAATKRVRGFSDEPSTTIWQRNYHERIIRTGTELTHTRQYILDNPRTWDMDEENPKTWKKPGLKLSVQGVSLTEAILKERRETYAKSSPPKNSA